MAQPQCLCICAKVHSAVIKHLAHSFSIIYGSGSLVCRNGSALISGLGNASLHIGTALRMCFSSSGQIVQNSSAAYIQQRLCAASARQEHGTIHKVRLRMSARLQRNSRKTKEQHTGHVSSEAEDASR